MALSNWSNARPVMPTFRATASVNAAHKDNEHRFEQNSRMVIEPAFRCATKVAINSLAAKFGLRITPGMQDWEYQVAVPDRLSEFLSAFEKGDLSDDERFCLMEIVFQSFEEFESDGKWRESWPKIENQLRVNFRLHAYTIWYWADFENSGLDSWSVSSPMRKIFRQHSPN